MIDREAIVKEIEKGLTTAQEARKKTNLERDVKYWTEMCFNPEDQWWSLANLRETGELSTLSNKQEDAQFFTTTNFINQEVLTSISNDLLSPIRFRVRVKGPRDFFEIPSLMAQNNGNPIEKDAYTDRVCDVLYSYLDKLDINADRERLYLGRYVHGTSYLTLMWDTEGGDVKFLPKRKNGEKWDVVSGEWSKDGQFFDIPNVGKIPREQMFSGEEFSMEPLKTGDPKTEVLYVWQVFWNGESLKDSDAVWLIDWMSPEEAKKHYSQTILYGKTEETEWDKLKPTAGLTFWENISQKVRQYFDREDKRKPTDYLRIRYRRKPRGYETRSQWFTQLNDTLVRAQECPYGKTFDKSLGIYGFFGRPYPRRVEGVPDMAYMITGQKKYNAISSMILEFINTQPYGAFAATGNPDSLNTNVTSGGGAKVITSNLPLTPVRLPQLGNEVLTERSNALMEIQHFGTSKQLVPGMRSQDLGTATQATIQQAYSQRLTNFNLFRDAKSWKLFLNDLMTLLSDPKHVSEMREVESVVGGQGVDVKWSSDLFSGVSELEVEVADLEKKGVEEEKRDIFAGLQMLGQPAAMGAGDALNELRQTLMKKWFDISNIEGVDWPEEPVETAQPELPPVVGEPASRLAPPPDQQFSAELPPQTQETIGNI